MSKNRIFTQANFPLLAIFFSLFLLLEYARSIHYLFFHTMVEGFAVVVSLSIFVLAWTSNRNLANGYLIILGSAYGAIALVDSFHALTFKGMNLFPNVSLNYTNQFWLTARFMEATALLLAPLLLQKKPNFFYFSAGFFASAVVACLAVVYQIFPATFIEGVGLSPFKIYSEYLIISMMSLALFLLYRRKNQFHPKLFLLLLASLSFAIAGEICFTLYVGFYDFSHELGHYFRFTSVVLAFIAIVLSGVRHPLDLLFREISRHQATLEILNAQLAESEQRYRLAFSIGPDAININRLSDGLYLDVNEAFLKLTGWNREEVIGKTSTDIGIWHRIEDRQRLVETLSHEGRCHNLEAEFVTKDGRILTAQMSAHVIMLKGESCILSVTRDVTAQKIIEQALEENREKYRALSEAAFEAIFITEKGIVLEQNAQARVMFGYSDQALIGQSVLELTVAEDREKALSNILNDYELPYEINVLRKDGSVFPAIIRGKMMHYKGRDVRVASVRDISERKQNQQRLERLLNEQKAMLETDLVGIVRLVNRKVEWVNPAFEKMMGYEAGELIGTSTRIHYLNEAAYLSLAEAAYPLLASGEVYRTQIEFVRKDGKHIWVDLSGTNLDAKMGESLWGFLDITEQKQSVIKLEDSAATLHALINANTETALLLDQAGTILAVNEVGAQRLRKPQAALVGENFYAQLPAELARVRQAEALQVFQTGLALQTQDERSGIRFANSIYPVFDSAGKVVNIAVYATDVTERMQLQGIDQLFFNINQKLLQGHSIDELFNYVCVEVPQIFGYQYAWIGSKEADGSVAVRAALAERATLEKMNVRWDDASHSRGPSGTAIRTGQSQLFKVSDTKYPPWLAAIQQYGFNAFLALPMIVRGEIIGAFSLYSKYENSFDSPEIIQRLTGITSRICIAVETAQDQQQLMLLRSALAATANGVFIADQSGKVLWVNQAFTYLTGFSEQECIGTIPRILSIRQHPANDQPLWETLSRGEVWRNEMEELHKDGSLFFVRQTITPILDNQGVISHFIAILEDISVERAAKNRIEHLAHYDALTQLPNRALFLDRLRQSISSAKRSNDVVALMFLDLDHFKAVNDTYGHQAGDALLQQVAERLKSCVRESDTVARLAGDEFTIILPEIASVEAATKVAEKIIAEFATPFALDGHTVLSSTSIGIALFPLNAGEEETLLKQADAAMYLAKQDGKNRFVFI